jgi:hypothetical protein
MGLAGTDFINTAIHRGGSWVTPSPNRFNGLFAVALQTVKTVTSFALARFHRDSSRC